VTSEEEIDDEEKNESDLEEGFEKEKKKKGEIKKSKEKEKEKETEEVFEGRKKFIKLNEEKNEKKNGGSDFSKQLSASKVLKKFINENENQVFKDLFL